ncbi:MAG TPA: diguanylate cyclase [Bryobacteraceae bacterium]|jgi:GGDEF domain-containing protein|nr:diguanylate cyclase [Bryobacteraceae bacterium]
MTETEQLNALHTAVNSYLTTLLAVSECIGEACPEVGGPYRHRLGRLRSRLAFDTTPEAIIESTVVVERELKEYSKRTAAYIEHHGIELRRAIDALENIVRALAQRQDFYGARLRQFAEQMQAMPYPADPEHLADVAALQTAGLLGCVESMDHDSQSLVARMRTELADVSERLKDSEVTDRLTGLMNRREMERQIDQRTASGDDPVILVFELTGDVTDEIARQVAIRLTSHFRHHDLICRWTDREFLVLFKGAREIATTRTEQIVRWITGKYTLDDGSSIEIGVEAGLVAPHLLTMQ